MDLLFDIAGEILKFVAWAIAIVLVIAIVFKRIAGYGSLISDLFRWLRNLIKPK